MVSMTGSKNDLRFALRGLLRRPGFTAVAVATLALGIGAPTAVFTLLDGVLLRPLPYDGADALLSLDHQGREGKDQLGMSPGLYRLYRDQARTLSSLGMYRNTVANLVVNGEPQRIPGQLATPSFFTTLRSEAASGRTFAAEEGRPDGAQVVLLSDALWRTNFGADPGILGKRVDLDGVLREVVGVMPPDFGYPDREARFWLPLQLDDANAPIASFGARAIGRMADGQAIEGVRAELDGMLGRLPELVPGGGSTFLMNVHIHTALAPLKESLVGDLAGTLWVLFASVGVVLLIACANVANLLLVRAEGRRRELALRVALGAGRLQVLRSFLGESLVLAGAGGALGLAVAVASVRLATRLIPTQFPRLAEVGVNVEVLGFAATLALGCAVFFGFLPLLRYGTGDIATQLREGGARGGTSGRERQRLRNGLVVSQVALALVLLVGSGLLLRSFAALRAVDPGFSPVGVLTARVTVPPAEIQAWDATARFFADLRARLAAQPGVTSVGYVSAVPLGGAGVNYTAIEVEDQPRGEDELPVFASWALASSGYFEAMKIPLLEGRAFQPGDGADRFRAAVVSRAFAHKWWPDRSPLGRHMRLGGDGDWYTIVGVVDDVRQTRLEEVTQEMVYFPIVIGQPDQFIAARNLDIVIRTSREPLSLVAALRREVHDLNPRIPLANPRPLADAVRQATARTSFAMAMLGAASVIALLLSLVGIYGVVSYIVSQRTREIGVRMALGASRTTVRGMVLRQGLLLSGGGVAVGLVAAGLLSRLMASMLYGVRPVDPATYLVVAAILTGVAGLACLIPASRAAAVDPGNALRVD